MADHRQQSNLLGPPELYRETGPNEDPGTTGNPFMDAMIRNYNRRDLAGRQQMGRTVNGAETYLASGNPCLDFFYHVIPGTSAKTLNEKLRCSWASDPLTTLKLVCNLRAIRGTGKSDKESFFTAALWLHRRHPRTLASNLAEFVRFGCFKDLPEILYRLLEGPGVRRKQKAEWLQRKGKKSPHSKRANRGKGRGRRFVTTVPREVRVSRAEEQMKREKEYARELRVEKRTEMAKKVAVRYAKNFDFQFLYDKVSQLFADSLKSDIESLNSGEFGKISLAAKWCPSVGSSYDRSTLLCESIARNIFPREVYYKDEPELEEAHYAYRVRDRLRKEVLVPLRKALSLPEVFMAEKRWSEIQYERVSSLAMKSHKETFLRHDGPRFTTYLDNKKKSSSKPDPKGSDVAGGRKLKNCLAVCDVSQSGKRKKKAAEVSLTLGLLVSGASEEPWRGKIITFSDDPKLHVAKGKNLREKLEFLKKEVKDSSESKDDEDKKKKKDINKVFDLILEVAEDGKVSKEAMVQRVFVFSDMEFDKASEWMTNYNVIHSRFVEKGFGDALPEIVFWKVGQSKSMPVAAATKQAALVSGFSKNLIRLFSSVEEAEINPVHVMESAISGHEYQGLVVVD